MSGPITGRRRFLGGLLAAGLLPNPTWADAGSPAFLSAAANQDGTFILCGISADLQIRFALPLPARGHAAAAHPSRPEAVAFARRPGTFAVVIDCVTGAQKAVLTCPESRHFYGHGAFSGDGSLLFTTENDFEAGVGRIGVWDTQQGYKRVDEWQSGGIGPHDIKRLPGTETLVVANGGIDTHPDTGRTKLNIATMRSNLAYVTGGDVLEVVESPSHLQKNSIRHLAVGPDGSVALGMQWQGTGAVPALVGTHSRGRALTLLEAPANNLREMEGYVGSIAMSQNGSTIAVTSPRGGILQRYDTQSSRLCDTQRLTDISGVVATNTGFVFTTGTGLLVRLADGEFTQEKQSTVSWDNHLVLV